MSKESLNELRMVIRYTLESVVMEAVQLSPQQLSAKQALDKAAPAAGGKAGVLFSRILSKRITPEEIEQLAGEVRSMAANDPRAVKLFNTALDDAQAGVAATKSIGDMISSTLSGVSPQPGQQITMRSVAR